MGNLLTRILVRSAARDEVDAMHKTVEGKQRTENLTEHLWSARGKAWLHVSHTPCLSCMGVCCQFQGLFWGVRMSVAFDEWHEARRQAYCEAYTTALRAHRDDPLASGEGAAPY